MERMSAKNDGKAAEEAVLRAADRYAKSGILRVVHVFPPFRRLFVNGRLMTIPVANHNLDFCGSWTERGGRMLQIEVKSTSKPQLAIWTDSGGIKDSQIQAMADWTIAGAACFVLWIHAGQMRFITLGNITAATVKHLKFDAGRAVAFRPQIGWDWIENLRGASL
jgi:penicillin-binding protein-related factor A (putative recombinase)